MVQQAVHSAPLDKHTRDTETAEVRLPCIGGKHSRQILQSSEKRFRHCGKGMGHFFCHKDFIFAFGDVVNG